MPLYHYVETVTNRAGDALAGYYVRILDGGGIPVPLYSNASSAPIVAVSGVANAAKTDANGRVSAYVADGYYSVQVYDKADNTIAIDDPIADVPMLSGTESFSFYLSQLDIYLTTGASLVKYPLPHDFIVSEVRAYVTESPTGAAIIVDIKENGASILSTKLTIDAGEQSSSTAAVPAVISDANLTDNAVLTFHIDQIGSTLPGKGLIVTIKGVRD